MTDLERVGWTSRGRRVRTVVRDCLCVNWALPSDALPDLPQPLTYERHRDSGGVFVFASGLLFRHEHLHLVGLPFLKLSYPQFHLRFYVRDHEGSPALFFHRVLVPGWVVPSARWVGHQPAVAAHFRYPEVSRSPDRDEEWSWSVEQRERTLGLTGRVAAPRIGVGPTLGTWQQTVDYFRHRSRGYVAGTGGLQPVETTRQRGSLWPLEVSIEDSGLLEACIGSDLEWPEPHSAWLCPELPYEFELSAAGLSESMRRAAPPIAPDPAMFRRRRPVPRRAAA